MGEKEGGREIDEGSLGKMGCACNDREERGWSEEAVQGRKEGRGRGGGERCREKSKRREFRERRGERGWKRGKKVESSSGSWSRIGRIERN